MNVILSYITEFTVGLIVIIYMVMKMIDQEELSFHTEVSNANPETSNGSCVLNADDQTIPIERIANSRMVH